MHKNIQTILEKDMSRREFLGYVGAAFLGVIGVSGILKALMSHENHGGVTKRVTSPVDFGYGSTPYGGSPARRFS